MSKEPFGLTARATEAAGGAHADLDLAEIVVSHSVDGLLVIDRDGIVQFANAAAVSLFSANTKQLVGFQLGAPAINEPVEISLRGAPEPLFLEMRAAEIVWKGNKASLASLRDITQRKRVEEELRQQTVELAERNKDLFRFNRVAVGRELRMIELKQEVNGLCARVGEAPRYRIPPCARKGEAACSGIPGPAPEEPLETGQ